MIVPNFVLGAEGLLRTVVVVESEFFIRPYSNPSAEFIVLVARMDKLQVVFALGVKVYSCPISE